MMRWWGIATILDRVSCILDVVGCLHACSQTSMVSRGVSPCTRGDSALGVLVTCMTFS